MKKMIKNSMRIIILLLLLTSVCFSANRYIDASNGNDANNGLSSSTAWQTLTKLNNSWSSIVAGDTIFLKRGESWNPSGLTSSNGVLHPATSKFGTASNYIVVSAYGSGNLPIISNVNSTSAYAFRATGISYFVFEYLEFRGNYMIKSNSNGFHHVKILHCTFDGQYSNGGIFTSEVVTEVSPENFSYNDIYDIEIGYCEVKNANNNERRSINFDTGTRNYWFHHNIVHDGVSAGVGINISQGIGSIVEYNTIYNCGAGIKIIPQRNRNDSVIIRGNLIYGLTDASGFGISLQNSRHSQIYNNTVYAEGGYGSLLVGWLPSNPVNFCGQGTWGFENNLIANNIFYGRIIFGTADNVGIRYTGRSDTIRYTKNFNSLKLLNTWTHNIYYPSSSTTLISEDHEGSGCVTYSTGNGTYNYTMSGRTYPVIATTSNFGTAWNGSASTITGEIYSNPKFMNIAAFNFRIPDNSPAYKTGSATVSYTIDLDGYTIYGVPSIGAYDHFTPPPPPPATPELRSPSNGTLNNTNPPLLSWNASTDAASYRLQVATDSSFSTKVFDDSTLTQTSKQVTSLSNNTKYYWRVNAKNNGGTSVYSPAWNFMTIIGLSSIPTLLQPIDGAINLPTALTLSWNASMYASTYRVQISADSLFITIKLDDSTITGTSKQAGSLLTNTKYYWRVNAKNMVGTSSYSKARTFTTLADTPATGVQLTMNRDSIDYGKVIVGTSKKDSVTLINSSSQSISISKIISTKSEYTVSPSALNLFPGNRQNVYVTFYASKRDTINGLVLQIFDSLRLIDTIKVTGRGVAPPKNVRHRRSLNITSTSVGAVNIDSFVVYNSGDLSLSILNIQSTEPSFSISPTSTIIAPSDSQYFYLTARSNDSQSKRGYLIFTDNSKETPDSMLVELTIKLNEQPIGILPASYALEQNYPNPFNPTTLIGYQLPVGGHVKITVYNTIGQEVRILVDEIQEAGYHSCLWDAANDEGILMPSSVYFYRIIVSGIDNEKFSHVKRMLLLK